MQAGISRASFPTDTVRSVLINRSAAGLLGWTPEQAIGKWIQNTIRDSLSRKIIGVVEDFNFLSLKEKMDGLVIAPNEDRRVILAKIRPGNISATIGRIRKAYNQVAPVYPFEYSFLDQNFDTLYKTDIRQQTILTIFSGLAISYSLPRIVWSRFFYSDKKNQGDWCPESAGLFNRLILSCSCRRIC